MNKFFFIIIIFFGFSSYSQTIESSREDKRAQVLNDTINEPSTKSTSNKNLKNKKATIDMYKIISYKRDTTYFDTTLSIKKDYKYNYLRKDNFELISFSNVGQTYNTLSSNFQNIHTLPVLGARARHFNYMEVEDINYYQVPTPFTELFYKTAFQQGQILDAFFTTNMSKQFNFSIAYKGMRSLGKYQHILTSTGNFRFTSNYQTKSGRYQARAHIVMQDLLNQENGGLTDEDVINFQSGDEEFKDRGVFDPIFQNAESILEGRRFYLDHKYNIIRGNDSLQHNFSLGNIISFEDKYFQFKQTARSDFFGSAFLNSNINDKVTLENFYNRVYINYDNPIIGNINFNVDYTNYNYGYNSLVILNGETITNRLKGSIVTLGGSYKKQIGAFQLDGEFGINISCDIEGNFFTGQAAYQLTDDINAIAKINSNSRQPNYNHLLYQSDYINYNWNNSNRFENIQTQQLAFKIESQKLANIELDYTNINNYTYFAKNEEQSIKPFQSEETINYFRIKLNREISYGKFALDNTVLYQNVLNGEDVLNIPQIITRNTLYFRDHLFKKAMYLETGITFNYFTKYNMNGYDPLLAEFYTQNQTKLGGFPRMDFFVNAKIRQTRIYIKAEHFNSHFTGYDYFSAPNNPYRDFTVRFGIVWNFFL
jgi:hypothetical protein